MKAQYQTFMKITQNSEKSTKEIYEDENEDFIRKWKIPEMYSIYIYIYTACFNGSGFFYILIKSSFLKIF